MTILFACKENELIFSYHDIFFDIISRWQLEQKLTRKYNLEVPSSIQPNFKHEEINARLILGVRSTVFVQNAGPSQAGGL